MRNSKYRGIIGLALIGILFFALATPTSVFANSCRCGGATSSGCAARAGEVDSRSACETLCGTGLESVSCVESYTDYTAPDAPAQRDQNPNSSVTRAFLKGAGYTAPASDMTCSTNAQGTEICVPSNDVRAYVVAIIRFVLSVVGFLFFALLFFAGYLWTTAGGNEEAVKKAQGIATKAIIGLAMILAAYAVTTFITTLLQKSVAP